METQTKSAKESLIEGLVGAGSDFSAFKMPEAPAETTVSDATLNNDSPDSTQDVEARGDSQDADQAKSQTSEKADGTTQKEGAATNRTDPENPTKPSKPRAPERIQELLEKDKANAAKIQELEKKLQEVTSVKPGVEAKTEEAKPLIPKPQAPSQYTREVLEQLEEKAEEEGDAALLRQVRKEIKKWDKHDLELVRWENNNKQEIEKHNSAVNYYRQEALKKWPGLGDANSDHSKAYAGMRGWISKEMPEMLSKPQGEFLLALISDWKLGSSRLAAADSELKKLRDEVQALKKGAQPLTTTGKVDVDSKGEGSNSIEEARSNLMQGIRTHNRVRSFA